MYKGELITFMFDDPGHLVALPLSNIEIDVSEKGIFVTRKDNQKKLGYIRALYGIKLEEFMSIFGYEPDPTK